MLLEVRATKRLLREKDFTSRVKKKVDREVKNIEKRTTFQERKTTRTRTPFRY